MAGFARIQWKFPSRYKMKPYDLIVRGLQAAFDKVHVVQVYVVVTLYEEFLLYKYHLYRFPITSSL